VPDHSTVDYLTLLAFALFANIPLGYWREGCPKFSFRWFLFIHISIPFIVLLRGHLGFNWHYIPLTLGCAIAGQIIGSRVRRHQT